MPWPCLDKLSDRWRSSIRIPACVMTGYLENSAPLSPWAKCCQLGALHCRPGKCKSQGDVLGNNGQLNTARLRGGTDALFGAQIL